MIGRASFGNPWIFARAAALLRGEQPPPPPDIDEICDTALRQFDMMREQKAITSPALEARKHYAWY